MKINEYLNNTYKKWLYFIVKSGLILSISIFCVNMFSLCICFYQHKEITLNIIYKILILNIINFILMLISVYNINNLDIKTSERKVRLNYFLISVFPIVFYTNYPVLLILPFISIIFAAIFENLKDMRFFYTASVLLIIYYFINNLSTEILEMANIIVAFILLNVIYKISKELYYMIREDNSYIKKILKKQNNLQKKLDIEPLTKLLNKRSLYRDLETIVKEKNKFSPCLVMIDLDLFKRINDTYGHVNGDKALLALTKHLNKIESKNIKAYRFGGEEFIVVTRNLDISKVYSIIDKMRKNFGNIKHSYLNNESITFSAGICKYAGTSEISKWIEKSDEALYQAKTEGRNRVIIYKE